MLRALAGESATGDDSVGSACKRLDQISHQRDTAVPAARAKESQRLLSLHTIMLETCDPVFEHIWIDGPDAAHHRQPVVLPTPTAYRRNRQYPTDRSHNRENKLGVSSTTL